MGENLISHAVAEGITIEDILDFCRTDHICILRFKDNDPSIIFEILKRANIILKEDAENNIEYDYMFESGNDSYYCTEYINTCYCEIFANDFINSFGKNILLPDNMLYNKNMQVILEIKN
jgi:predicted nuclease of restriction endonuclease-like RecB superfamily